MFAHLPGLQHGDVNTKFWRRRRAQFGERDVVLRTPALLVYLKMHEDCYLPQNPLTVWQDQKEYVGYRMAK